MDEGRAVTDLHDFKTSGVAITRGQNVWTVVVTYSADNPDSESAARRILESVHVKGQ
jgi:hypothetical protein